MKTHQLQGIRGLAALLVVVGHCLGLFATPIWFDHLKNYSSGHAAVVMFFLLSGFVLTLSLHRGHTQTSVFYVKRLFRIYPAWIVACTVSLLYLLAIHYRFPITIGSDWWNARFQPQRMHPLYIAASYSGGLAFLLPQGWTIFIELVASLLMPFIAYGALHRRKLFYLAMGLCLALSVTIGSHTYYGLLSYLVDFFLGAWLAAPPAFVLVLVRKTERWTIPGLIAAVVVLLAYRNVFPPPGGELSITAYNDGFTQLVEAACCFWILAVVIHGANPLRVLDGKTLSWLGEISFSFYLIHVPIMCLLAQGVALLRLDPIGLSLLLLALTLPISLICAMAMHRWVEQPGIKAGKHFTQAAAATIANPRRPTAKSPAE